MSDASEVLKSEDIFTALSNENTYATVLYAILLVLYPDLHEMDSLELYSKIQDDFGEMLPQDNENKIQAILAAVTTEYFYSDLEVFSSICKTLYSGDPGVADFDFEAPDIAEILWGLYEVELNEDDRIQMQFNKSINDYIVDLFDKEAEENDEIESSENVLPGYEGLMTLKILELRKQLKEVGFRNFKMPEFIPKN